MNSAERRNRLINILEKSRNPIKGNELSKDLSVSRQVIVQDIALIRAKGFYIIATPQGYIMNNQGKVIESILCKNHNNDSEIYEELETIVDMGATIKDVIINHPTYGEIKAELNISSKRDILAFMEQVKNNQFKQLSSLSLGNHIHRIEASSQNIIDEIIAELLKKEILSI